MPNSASATAKSSPFRRDKDGREVCNLLLVSLSSQAYELVKPQLAYVELPLGLELRIPEEPGQFAYFPNSGIVSLVVMTEDGASAEVSVVGREGMSGASFSVGLRRSPLRELMQLPGDGYRIRFTALQELLDRNSEFQQLLARYAVYQGMEIAQIAGCNRLHKAEQRLARWLLMVQDRSKSDTIPATQDFLAVLLGSTRPSVSGIASALQKRGAIQYGRGRIRIANRKLLEASACECYRIISNWIVD